MAEERLRQLAREDPAKTRAVCEWLRALIDPAAVAMADDLERVLARQASHEIL